MFQFLLVVQALVGAAMIGVILMQRSEGGGLGVGGSPSGLMSARGAADFLTRATTVLAIVFVSLSIALAALASANRSTSEIDTTLTRARTPAQQAPAQQGSATGVPLDTAPPSDDPLAAAAARAAAGNEAAPAEQPPQGGVPLDQ